MFAFAFCIECKIVNMP